MSTLALILTATTAGGVASSLLASLFLLLPQPKQMRLVPHLVSCAAGTLLAAAAGGLLPQAFACGASERRWAVGLTLLAGLFLFFLIERLVLWRHCHVVECPVHSTGQAQAIMPLVLVGDTIHNLVDGILLGAAYVTDPHLGLMAAVAITAHEIPQELGDIVLLTSNGLRPGLAVTLNAASGLAMVAGGLLAWASYLWAQSVVPYAFALAAASFLYIGLADLFPKLHEQPQTRPTIAQILSMASGAALVLALD